MCSLNFGKSAMREIQECFKAWRWIELLMVYDFFSSHSLRARAIQFLKGRPSEAGAQHPPVQL